jgi:hypothetical protein
MKIVFLVLFLLVLLFTSFAGTVTIRYGDDLVIDCEMAHWERNGGGYFCYGDRYLSGITFFQLTNRWERYYYKMPIPLLLTEAPADSAFLKIYRPLEDYYYPQDQFTLTVNRLTEDLTEFFEHHVGNYEAPIHDNYNIDTSLTLPNNYTGWITFNITHLINNWALKEFDNHGLVVRMLIEDYPTWQSINICQSLYPDSSKWPTIEVHAKFLPDTFLTSPSMTTSIYKENINFPKDIELSIFPNPFNPSTTISYKYPMNEQVDIYLYNIQGQLIRHFDKISTNGLNSVIWNGRDTHDNDVSSGTYFCILKSKNFKISKKIILIR